MGMDKVSLTLEEELVTEARSVAGAKGLSAYVNDALRHKLQRDRLRLLLEELEREHGPIPERVREEVRREWPLPHDEPRQRRIA